MTLKRPTNKLFPVEFSKPKNKELNFVNEKDIPQVVVGAVLHNQEYTRDFRIIWYFVYYEFFHYKILL